jgi:hypothetical protein
MGEILTFGLAVSVLLLVPAYIGPGAGLTVIGTVVAFVAAIFLAIVGFVWYPTKRLIAKIRGKRQKEAQSPQEGE